MKFLKALILFLFCLLIFAVSFGMDIAAADNPNSQLNILAEEISAGSYMIVPLEWQVVGTTAGGGYTLEASQAVPLTGSGCCCTYLPCVIRSP